MLGARWYAGGLFLKEVKSGQEIRATRLYQVRSGDFVYNRLFAWKGSFALATAEADGCSVSNEFPCFEIDSTRLDARFLWSYFRRENAWNEALGLSTGATPTSRNRLKESLFLKMRMPLPPLPEQQRIVARIKELTVRIREGRELRRASGELTDALLKSAVMEMRSSEAWQELPLGDVCDILDHRREPVNTSERSSRQGAIPYYGAGKQVGWIDDFLFDEPLVLLAEDGGPFDWRCAYHIDGKSWVNNHAHVLRGKAVSNKWLAWMLRSTDLRPYLSGSTRAKLPQGKMKQIPIPVPPADDQTRLTRNLDRLEAQVAALGRTQREVSAELDALIPAILDRAFKGDL